MSEFPKTVPSPKEDSVAETPARDGCLSTDAALSFARGTLSPGELKALDAHVDACSDCQRLVVEAVRGLNSDRLDVSELEPGKTVFAPNTLVSGRYRIRKFIARGGMGEVYEAWDVELEAPIALKTVAPGVGDSPRALRYLKEELLHARRIAHPNVCRIFDFGTHAVEGARSIHFLTMELIEGKSLAKHVRTQGPFPSERFERIARELLAGLGAAHAAGVLHRDFKSDNVVLRSNDRGFTAVILDFGLARPIQHDSRSSSRSPAGTMVYMAPEQLEGKRLGPPADLYAFGVVCYEMLTGRRPFEDERGVEAPFERLRTDPRPPSHLNRAVPRGLDAIVLRCLARDPALRYQTAGDVLSAFEALDRTPSARVPKLRVSPWILGVIPVATIATYAWVTQPEGGAPPVSIDRALAAASPPSPRSATQSAASTARGRDTTPPSSAPAAPYPTTPLDARSPASAATPSKAVPRVRPARRQTQHTPAPSSAPVMTAWERIRRPSATLDQNADQTTRAATR